MNENNFSSQNRILINYWLTIAYFARLEIINKLGASDDSRNFLLTKMNKNGLGSWKQLKKNKMKIEAKNLESLFKKNKKQLLECKDISIKYRAALMLLF